MRLRNLMVPVVAVALSVTACGGDESPSGDETPDNGDAAGDESSADDAEESEDSGDAEGSDDEGADDESGSGGGDASAILEAMANAFAEAGSFEFESITTQGGQETTMTGAMEFGSDGSSTNMRVSANAAGVESTMLSVDGQVYVEMTEEMGMPGAEGSWLTFGSGDGGQLGEDMTGALDEIGDAADLSAQIEENAEHLTVTEVGTATVDGVETTEYEVVDAEGATGMGNSSMWIDGDNLLRRMVQRPADGEPIEMTYRNYGVDVEIEAPPEDEVVDVNEMMNQ